MASLNLLIKIQMKRRPGLHDENKPPLSPCSNPMVTGTSVLGVKFTGGVIIAADMLGSYGSLARFRNISRLMKVTVAANRTSSAAGEHTCSVDSFGFLFQVNGNTILGASGDYADYQYLKQIIEQMV